MKQKYLIAAISSLLSLGLNAQSYAAGYTTERIELIEQLFNQDCNGTQTYCDCIVSGVTSTIPFNKLRDSESVEQINKIIRGCQVKYKQFPYDPSRPPRLLVNSNVTFNDRSDSTLFENDTLRLNYSIVNEGIGTAYVPSLIVSINGPAGNYINYTKRVQFPDMEPLTVKQAH